MVVVVMGRRRVVVVLVLVGGDGTHQCFFLLIETIENIPGIAFSMS